MIRDQSVRGKDKKAEKRGRTKVSEQLRAGERDLQQIPDFFDLLGQTPDRRIPVVYGFFLRRVLM